VYVLPLLGAYLADAHWGRFRTILTFSFIYLAGMAGLTGINLSPQMQPRFNKAPKNGYAPTVKAFWVFM